MTICYFIQTHRDARQIVRLARTLRRADGGAVILVGHDSTGCPLTAGDFAGIADVDLFHFRGPAERGRLSLLEPYFQALGHLESRGVAFDWLAYLSGQDYPVRPLRESAERLRSSNRDGFLTFGDAFAPDNPMGRRRQGDLRYAFQYRTLPDSLRPLCRALRFLNGFQRIVHVHTTYQPRIGVRARKSPFGAARRCFVGSQWTTLNRACTDFLLASWRSEQELIDYYRRTVCSDESLVQTLLVNSGRFRLENDNLRYVRMAGTRDGHPRVLGSADFEALTSGPWHFARKFDLDVDAAVLDRLDARVLA